jgi:hypothetical protein
MRHTKRRVDIYAALAQHNYIDYAGEIVGTRCGHRPSKIRTRTPYSEAAFQISMAGSMMRHRGPILDIQMQDRIPGPYDSLDKIPASSATGIVPTHGRFRAVIWASMGNGASVPDRAAYNGCYCAALRGALFDGEQNGGGYEDSQTE